MRARLSVVLLVAALMAGCASDTASPRFQVESPAGSSSAPGSAASTSPTASSTPTPTTSPIVSAPIIEVGGFAEVVVDALNIRSTPGVVSSQEVPQASSLLELGDRVFLAEGPVSASGYDWYF